MKGRHAALLLILFIVITGSPAAAAESIPLRYHPKVGEKRTLRVNFDLATTNTMPYGPECTEHIRTFTVEVEPISVTDDGSVVTRIGFLKIYRKSYRHSDGMAFEQFDSDRDLFEYNLSGGKLRAPLGASFTVVTSAPGKIVKWSLDVFYDAVARNRMKHEDEVIQRMPKQRAAETLKEMKEKYGSPERRLRAYKEEAPKFLGYRPEELHLLANTVLVPFAPEPVAIGGTWKAPVMLSIEAPMELTGTYTLQTVESSAGTIQVEAQRTPQDKASGTPPGPAGAGPKFSGPYQATLKVDRATGCLLARQDLMNLTGELFWPGHSAAKPDGSVPVTIKATTTVEEVK